MSQDLCPLSLDSVLWAAKSEVFSLPHQQKWLVTWNVQRPAGWSRCLQSSSMMRLRNRSPKGGFIPSSDLLGAETEWTISLSILFDPQSVSFEGPNSIAVKAFYSQMFSSSTHGGPESGNLPSSLLPPSHPLLPCNLLPPCNLLLFWSRKQSHVGTTAL